MQRFRKFNGTALAARKKWICLKEIRAGWVVLSGQLNFQFKIKQSYVYNVVSFFKGLDISAPSILHTLLVKSHPQLITRAAIKRAFPLPLLSLIEWVFQNLCTQLSMAKYCQLPLSRHKFTIDHKSNIHEL